jgi:riboflavin biosynthesis pyrimidine reductase
VLFGSPLAASLVDTVELGISPVLLGRSGARMLALDRALSGAVRLELTRHEVLATGLLVLAYGVRVS